MLSTLHQQLKKSIFPLEIHIIDVFSVLTIRKSCTNNIRGIYFLNIWTENNNYKFQGRMFYDILIANIFLRLEGLKGKNDIGTYI